LTAAVQLVVAAEQQVSTARSAALPKKPRSVAVRASRVQTPWTPSVLES